MTIDDTRALITSDESQTLQEKKTCLTEVAKEWKYNNRKIS